MDDAALVTFRCPKCEAELEVNDAMKTALLHHGCVVCTASLSDSHFVEYSI